MPKTLDAGSRAAAPFMLAEEELPRALNVLGERITILASSGCTGGLELFRQQGEPGQGPPPHAHEWNETFYIVAGEIEFGAGDQSRRLGPGSVAHVPGGVTHWFRFVTDGEMISVTSQRGASQLFSAIDAASPSGAPDIDLLLRVVSSNGVTLAAPSS
jgi:mannose-6-phosphate isomerase-like protein (cupin superfamily)